MFRIPLERRRRTGLRTKGETVGTANGTDRLHAALGALDAARTVGNPAVALSALDSLDAESAVLRGIVTAELDTVGHEPLIGADANGFTSGGPAFPAAAGRDALIDDRRTRSAH
jgi:hypothetical protein